MSLPTKAELDDWLKNKTIVEPRYDTELNVLALVLDDGSVLICYTETLAKGLKKETDVYTV